MNNLKIKLILTSLMITSLASTPVSAVPIAIVDSGVDLSHIRLQNVKWTNIHDEDDAVDNDDNTYIDDTHGWNFAEANNKLFDKRLVGKFSKDVYLFFAIQTKMMQGVATTEEIDWMRAKVKEPIFLSELQTFGNFVHGSHVAGIAANASSKAEIMGIKLIPTKSPKLFSIIESNGMVASASYAGNEEKKKKLVLLAIDFLAKNQAKIFAPISAYMKAQGARVANCSFGTGHKQAKALFKPLLEKIFKREMTDAEINEYASYFINGISEGTTDSFINGSGKTFFVIAAGNDGTNNDEFPASPANIKKDNTITVAATYGISKLASFSNYGARMVDIAAPGVAIESSIPGGEFLHLSGTSQAAPHVANTAGQVLDVNPNLMPFEVKEILMKTTDQKEFLQGKVVSGGLLNANRALAAARHSLTLSIEESISRSVREVRDQKELATSFVAQEGAYVLPLPGLVR